MTRRQHPRGLAWVFNDTSIKSMTELVVNCRLGSSPVQHGHGTNEGVSTGGASMYLELLSAS